MFIRKQSTFSGLNGLIQIQIQSKNPCLIVAVEKFDFESNFNLLTLIKGTQRNHYDLKIGISFSQATSDDDLKNLFLWFWKNSIILLSLLTHLINTLLCTTFSYRSFSHCSFDISRILCSKLYSINFVA